MSSALSHYMAAEAHLRSLRDYEVEEPIYSAIAAEAQVHATLALAGASMLASLPSEYGQKDRDSFVDLVIDKKRGPVQYPGGWADGRVR